MRRGLRSAGTRRGAELVKQVDKAMQIVDVNVTYRTLGCMTHQARTSAGRLFRTRVVHQRANRARRTHAETRTSESAFIGRRTLTGEEEVPRQGCRMSVVGMSELWVILNGKDEQRLVCVSFELSAERV